MMEEEEMIAIGQKTRELLAKNDQLQRDSGIVSETEKWKFGIGLGIASLFMLLISFQLPGVGGIIFSPFSIVCFFVAVHFMDKSVPRTNWIEFFLAPVRKLRSLVH
jgi:hypothetical protein